VSKTDAKVSLFGRLELELKDVAFKLVKPRAAYERERGNVTDTYSLGFLSSSKGDRIQPGLNMRYAELDRIYHQVSGARPADQKQHAAISFAIWRVYGGREKYEFLLAGEDTVERVAAQLIRTFREVALPFFESHSTIADVDRLFNEQPNSPESRLYNLNNVMRCCYATTAAKLVGNPRYAEIVQSYSEFLQAADQGFYVPQYQALVQRLEADAAETTA